MASKTNAAEKVAKHFYSKGIKFTQFDVQRQFYPKRGEKFIREIMRCLEEPRTKYRVVKCLDFHNEFLSISYLVTGLRQ